ncbi:MAG: GNAT family N-acetyltransferase [Candidatus Heimdallarchaeota archaeon]|nr:GNAT family N-acetyltransferase [Candidatus Heimdallarchaeota archaeon]
MPLDYYLRNPALTEWEKFHELDKTFFSETVKKKSFEDVLKRPRASYIVAVDKSNNSFLGYYQIAAYGKEGIIHRIGVHPQVQRKGLGTKLLESAINSLKEAGCTKIKLYVRTDNEAAINLYKKFDFEIEKKSYQFIVKYSDLIDEPQGKCREAQWHEIPMFCLIFNQNPDQIKLYFGQENQLVLVYEYRGEQLGFCRFSPQFPGAMPFLIKNTDFMMDFISLLKQYISDPQFDSFKLTIDNQKELVQLLIDKGISINYELYVMTKSVPLTEEEK